MDLIFATNNLHKLDEIRSLTQSRVQIYGLSDAGFKGEIPEEFPTLEQNASQKAWFIYRKLNKNCFADDTGLEVEALNGDPGVFSARYSQIGEITYPEMDVTQGNIRKLLRLMTNEHNRNARFRTVISLIIDGIEYQFEGIIQGTIAHEKSGAMGFGYDPVFFPVGESSSFAEMSIEKKNSISHRAIAMNKLVGFLDNFLHQSTSSKPTSANTGQTFHNGVEDIHS
jgi:XTP/dITP diphosphohydrolase